MTIFLICLCHIFLSSKKWRKNWMRDDSWASKEYVSVIVVLCIFIGGRYFKKMKNQRTYDTKISYARGKTSEKKYAMSFFSFAGPSSAVKKRRKLKIRLLIFIKLHLHSFLILILTIDSYLFPTTKKSLHDTANIFYYYFFIVTIIVVIILIFW